MIKKFISVTLAALALLSLSGCSASENNDDGRLKIVATNFALYDFAENVCGDLANVTMLLPLETESHDFEATLGDIDKIASSDLFIHTGGESEDWVEDVFASLESMNISVSTVCAAEIVETFDEEIVEGMQSDGEEDEEDSFDEHVWTSIPNAEEIIRAISAEVSRLEPDIAGEVSIRSEEYIAQLDEIDAEIMETVNTAKRRTIIVADRFPFRYFAERYSLEYYAAFSGCTSNTEPTLSTINFLIEKVRSEEIPVVLTIEFSDKKCAMAVADETGCGILELHSAHNVTKEDFDSGVTYAELMRRNLEVLKIALN